MLGVLSHLNAEPARFSRNKKFRGHTIRAVSSQQDGVITVGIGGDVLRLDPQGGAAGLLRMKSKGHTDGARHGAVLDIQQRAAEFDEPGNFGCRSSGRDRARICGIARLRQHCGGKKQRHHKHCDQDAGSFHLIPLSSRQTKSMDALGKSQMQWN